MVRIGLRQACPDGASRHPISAAVTGSNMSPPLWSMAPIARKCGNMTAPARSARRGPSQGIEQRGDRTGSHNVEVVVFSFENQGLRSRVQRLQPERRGLRLWLRDQIASVSRKCRRNTTGTLHFVRRNDILLQRGMTLRRVAALLGRFLPRLGPFGSIRTALFLFYPKALADAIRRRPLGWLSLEDADGDGPHHALEIGSQAVERRAISRNSPRPYRARD